MLKHDEIEYKDEYKEIFKKVDREVEEKLNREGVQKSFGYIHIFDSYKKKILKERYNINWKTTQEMNSNVMID